MKPADDPTWPKCTEPTDHGGNVQPGCHEFLDGDWCVHVRQFFVHARDALTIDTNVRTCVPIYPEKKLYAEVAIELFENNDDVGFLKLIKRNPWTLAEDEVHLGLWNRGEGRISMWSVIMDQVMSYDLDGHPRCKQSAHGFNEQRKLSEIMASPKQIGIDSHKFTLSMFDMCLPCWEKSQALQGAALGSISSAMGNTGQSSTSAAAQALRNKFTRAQLDGREPTPLGDNTYAVPEMF